MNPFSVALWRLRPFGAVFFLVLLWALPGAAADGLPRVMGTNLCADLLLMSLAAPEQIVSLSRASRDPAMSLIWERARKYPSNRGGIEDLLYRQPDIALVYSGWSGGRFGALLADREIEILSIPYPTDWDDALATALMVSRKIGRADHGARLTAAADRSMDRVRIGGLAPRVLYLRPGGGSAGSGTYVDDVIERLGLRNLAAESGHSGWGAFPLEQIVLDPPDVFLLGFFERTQPLTGSAYARHPLLRTLLAQETKIQVPSRSWGCGGLELLRAAEAIAGRLRTLDKNSAP